MKDIDRERLATCHPLLVQIVLQADMLTPLRVLCGHRGEAEQNGAFFRGASKVKFPKSAHNAVPSMAVDLAPLPLNWQNANAFYGLHSRVRAIANVMLIHYDYDMIWGGDWDNDGDFKDQSFNDLVHYELRRKKNHGQ